VDDAESRPWLQTYNQMRMQAKRACARRRQHRERCRTPLCRRWPPALTGLPPC